MTRNNVLSYPFSDCFQPLINLLGKGLYVIEYYQLDYASKIGFEKFKIESMYAGNHNNLFYI